MLRRTLFLFTFWSAFAGLAVLAACENHDSPTRIKPSEVANQPAARSESELEKAARARLCKRDPTKCDEGNNSPPPDADANKGDKQDGTKTSGDVSDSASPDPAALSAALREFFQNLPGATLLWPPEGKNLAATGAVNPDRIAFLDLTSADSLMAIERSYLDGFADAQDPAQVAANQNFNSDIESVKLRTNVNGGPSSVGQLILEFRLKTLNGVFFPAKNSVELSALLQPTGLAGEYQFEPTLGTSGLRITGRAKCSDQDCSTLAIRLERKEPPGSTRQVARTSLILRRMLIAPNSVRAKFVVSGESARWNPEAPASMKDDSLKQVAEVFRNYYRYIWKDKVYLPTKQNRLKSVELRTLAKAYGSALYDVQLSVLDPNSEGADEETALPPKTSTYRILGPLLQQEAEETVGVGVGGGVGVPATIISRSGGTSQPLSEAFDKLNARLVKNLGDGELVLRLSPPLNSETPPEVRASEAVQVHLTLYSPGK